MNNDLYSFQSEDAIANILFLINDRFGYDFRDYSMASLKRRIDRIMTKFNVPNLSELESKLVSDDGFFRLFLEEVTVNVTEMFRNPSFYKFIRESIIPNLRSYPFIRVWHAGCSTGEEVYSMAIILKEEGLLNRSLIYATDINQHVLETAQQGTYPIDQMKSYAENYLLAGGIDHLNSYFSVVSGRAIFNKDLKNRMVFSNHNLVTDQSFNEFNLILCRNVLIYFNQNLQQKVFNLFYNSLASFGYIALGTKETINHSNLLSHFTPIDGKFRIWKKTI